MAAGGGAVEQVGRRRQPEWRLQQWQWRDQRSERNRQYDPSGSGDAVRRRGVQRKEYAGVDENGRRSKNAGQKEED